MSAPRVSLALSGGGHRACIFALGVLLYLARAGKTADLGSVVSVSGGSLANGAVAQDLDLATCDANDVERVVANVARRVTGRGTVFAAPIVWAYLASLVVLTVAVLVGTWLLPIAIGWRIAIFVVGILVLGVVATLRGRVTGRAFAQTLFTRDGKRTPLAGIHTGVDHVFCATDLHAGEHVYFSGAFVYAYRFGLGTPGDLPLHRAVQASAAFPGAFPVSWMRTSRFGFAGAREEAKRTRALALQDGGVYDNMGDQWGQGLEERNRLTGGRFRIAEELVVANASAGLAFGSTATLRMPWLGELLTLLRDKSVLYDNGNSVRRRELVARFDMAERERSGLRGALVHIEQSPFRVPEHFVGSTEWPERAQRAETALAALLADDADPAGVRADWARVAAENAAVPTTLAGLKPQVTARLLHHAFVLAAVNLHVVLGYPLVRFPPRAELEALVAGRPAARRVKVVS